MDLNSEHDLGVGSPKLGVWAKKGCEVLEIPPTSVEHKLDIVHFDFAKGVQNALNTTECVGNLDRLHHFLTT